MAGYSGDKIFSPVSHAFLSGANGGPLKDLGTLPGYTSRSFAYAVNASGQVAGASADSAGNSHIFLSGVNGGPLKDLGSLGGATSALAVGTALGVNEAGQVTGGSIIADGHQHAYLSGANGGALKDLGTLPGYTYSSEGYAVNSAGQVTGFSIGDVAYHAFLSGVNGGPLQDLGALPGDALSRGKGINDAGQVVGSSQTSRFSDSTAFLFSNGVMKNLNSLIAPGSGFTLFDANGISDTGFIIGSASDAKGNDYSVLLTPAPPAVPEASTTVSLGLLLALGVGGLLVRGRRKRKA